MLWKNDRARALSYVLGVGGLAVKSSRSRSGTGLADGSGTVVTWPLPSGSPAMPYLRTTRPTRLRFTRSPASRSSAVMRGWPSVASHSACTGRFELGRVDLHHHERSLLSWPPAGPGSEVSTTRGQVPDHVPQRTCGSDPWTGIHETAPARRSTPPTAAREQCEHPTTAPHQPPDQPLQDGGASSLPQSITTGHAPARNRHARTHNLRTHRHAIAVRSRTRRPGSVGRPPGTHFLPWPSVYGRAMVAAQ